MIGKATKIPSKKAPGNFGMTSVRVVHEYVDVLTEVIVSSD